MASGRMVSKALHSNPDLGDLDINIRYFYIGLIVHSDDDGRMRANSKFLKATIFPFDFELRLETIEEWLRKLCDAKLISLYAVDGKRYIAHPNWNTWQKVRKDRHTPTDCPSPDEGSQVGLPDDGALSTTCQPVDNQLTTKCQPDVRRMTPQPNLTEPNLTELKSQASPAVSYSQALVEKAEKAETFGFNVYKQVGKYCKGKLFKIPESVINEILDEFFEHKDSIKGEIFPYMDKVVQEKSRRYWSEANQAEHARIKKEPVNVGGILRQMAQQA